MAITDLIVIYSFMRFIPNAVLMLEYHLCNYLCNNHTYTVSFWCKREFTALGNLGSKWSSGSVKTSTPTSCRSFRYFGKVLNNRRPLNTKLLQYMVVTLNGIVGAFGTVPCCSVRGRCNTRCQNLVATVPRSSICISLHMSLVFRE